jgi:hypothetical protein
LGFFVRQTTTYIRQLTRRHHDMATVSLLNVSVRNNPAPFNSPYEFEITFECLEPLQRDLEWKLTYVGSATSYVPGDSAASVASITDT